MSDSMTYNQWVLQILRNRGHDDSKIAEMLGASRTTVNQIINGKRSGRNIAQKIRKLAEASNFTAEETRAGGIEEVTRISITRPPSEPPGPPTLSDLATGAVRYVKTQAYLHQRAVEEQKREIEQIKKAAQQHGLPMPITKPTKLPPVRVERVESSPRRSTRKSSKPGKTPPLTGLNMLLDKIITHQRGYPFQVHSHVSDEAPQESFSIPPQEKKRYGRVSEYIEGPRASDFLSGQDNPLPLMRVGAIRQFHTGEQSVCTSCGRSGRLVRTPQGILCDRCYASSW